jgi:hypothetical protein
MEVAVRSEMWVNIYTNPHSRKSQETSFFSNSGASQLLLIIKGYMVLRVVRLLLNNQPDALIIQIYSVIKHYMFWWASSLPIIRSFLLYIRHW